MELWQTAKQRKIATNVFFFIIRKIVSQLMTEQSNNNEYDKSTPVKINHAIKGDSELKLEWANKILLKNMEIKTKIQEIEAQQNHRKTVKNNRDEYQFQLKHLYKNILAEPTLAISRGLVLIFN